MRRVADREKDGRQERKRERENERDREMKIACDRKCQDKVVV